MALFLERRSRNFEENYNFDYGFKYVTKDDDYTKLLDVTLFADHTTNSFVPENYVVTSFADHYLMTDYNGGFNKE